MHAQALRYPEEVRMDGIDFIMSQRHYGTVDLITESAEIYGVEYELWHDGYEPKYELTGGRLRSGNPVSETLLLTISAIYHNQVLKTLFKQIFKR
jgi:hypothetical protein